MACGQGVRQLRGAGARGLHFGQRGCGARGFLTHTTVANASWAWGKLGFVVSGNGTGFATSSPTDCLYDLFYGLRAEYRANSTWLMSSATANVVSKFKDGEGRHVWQPSLQEGRPPTLIGRPVVIVEDMPPVGAGNFPIAFGDFRRGYTIVDRQGVRVLRDPYSAKPHVLFYTTKRVGGDVTDFAAIKLLKIAAS
ncbi:MAG: phage major capsid protein [Candidatus Competibacteraceae bacterium]|nr:phage major capsid protein [Candidatus Competibacteraceae bacterium]